VALSDDSVCLSVCYQCSFNVDLTCNRQLDATATKR